MESAKQHIIETSENSQREARQNKPKSSKLCEKYELMHEIGHGAQGRIFMAARRDQNDCVVVKQLNIESIKTWKAYELFQREAEVLRSIDIDGVAKFYDAIECLDDNPPCSYIVQEYIEGVSLQKMIDENHRFSMEDVYEILIQTLTILDKLHHHDPPIIHRDIKPSNLMISPMPKGSFKVTIIDFGAVANPQLQGGGSTVAGTYGYMPPEQLTGKPVPASDIYAVAALAVQLFSGTAPGDIPVKDFRLIFEPLVQDKPHELVTLLRNMLEPRVEERLADIPQIIEKLKNYKDNRFQLAAFQNTQDSYSESYEQKLQAVRSVCASGNMGIWQQLQDKEVRAVPKVYKTYYQTLVSQRRKKRAASVLVTPLVSILLVAIAMAVFILVVGLSIFLIWQFGLFELLNGFLGVFMILGEMGIISFGAYLAYTTGSFLCYRYKRSLNSNRVTPEQISNAEKVIDLIHNSRKSVATITNITYLPVPDFTPEVGDEVSPALRYITDSRPAFQIQYKFNPPDDKRTEDIVHNYITHVEPEGHYRVGDPISILYRIENNYFSDTVRSMPFPLPLIDFEDRTRVIDESKSGVSDEMPEFKNIVYDDAVLNYLTGCFIKARSIGELRSAIVSASVADKKYARILMQYIVKVLTTPGCAKCHCNCIDALSEMAFPLLNEDRDDRVPEAFDHIIQYIYQKPRCKERPSIHDIQELRMVKLRSTANGYTIPESYYLGMLDLMQDPNISDGVRFMIADDMCYNTPRHIMQKAQSMIPKLTIPNASECLPEDMIQFMYEKNKAEILEALNNQISYGL